MLARSPIDVQPHPFDRRSRPNHSRLGSRALQQLGGHFGVCGHSCSRVPMQYGTNLGRDRNKVKFNSWGVYLRGEAEEQCNTLKSLQTAAETHKARVPGGPMQALTFHKVSRNKVEVSWPRPVGADACARVLKLALGEGWRDFVTDPAGVQGAQQTAATVKEEVPLATVKMEVPPATAKVEVPASSAGPSSSGTLASMAATVEEPKPEAATMASVRKPHLLPLKLEAITALYLVKDKNHYEDLQQAYTVDWAAELGQGSYGKVYVGTKRSATDTAAKDTEDEDTANKVDTSFAIKMLRDRNTGWAADQEVRRHAALGFHPNLVGLVGVGLFCEPPERPGCNSPKAHIGLVCDMYEIDVRQFLKKSLFTQGGMRHVLNSVLEGLRFIHDQGCIHCDLKPANIFMRGAIHLRGCFLSDRSELQQLGDFQNHSRAEFQHQIPNSFEVREG